MKKIPVKITNAHKYYNKGKSNQLHVMDDVNLELPESGMVAIFGQSGCGKTTLLNAIGGLDSIASGSIELFGRNIRKDTDTLRNRYVGYIFQNYNLNMGETVYENVSAALRLCGMNDETAIFERTIAALANVDMDKYRDRTPDTLSGGQQQRVAIARALVKNPAIILADEPTGNLDEANTVMVMDILKEISRTHLVLLVTHEANLVDYYCDRVIEIVDGHVESDRINEDANGYVQRNKSHIYLGELPKTEVAAGGVKLEYYGEHEASVTLQLVCMGGKLYLKTNDPSVKLLDESSEIKLVEGVYCPTPEKNTRNGHKLDMSKLTPIEGKNFGRLYHWKNSLRYAWRENFSVKKKKKGRRLLRACLFLLAVVMVFMTAVSAAGVRSFTDLRRDHNDRVFYIPLDPEMDYSAISAEIGNYGMDFARIIGSSPAYDGDYLHFQSAAFMTSKSVTLSARGQMVDAAHAEELPVVEGEGTVKKGSYDILVTTALADKLIESSSARYIDGYEDLIGLISANDYGNASGTKLRITGVVRSDELFYYADGLTMAKSVMNQYFWMPVVPASQVGMEKILKPGEMICRYMFDGGNLAAGDTVHLLGKSFVVANVDRDKYSLSAYPAFVFDTFGVTLVENPTEYATKMNMQSEIGFYSWFLDHYITYLPEFLRAKMEEQPDKSLTYEEWAIATKESIVSCANLLGYDPWAICSAMLYREENPDYAAASNEEIQAYFERPDVIERVEKMVSDTSDRWEYDEYLFQFEVYGNSDYDYVICDEDYIALAGSAGKTDQDKLNVHTYEVWDSYNGERFYSNYLMIRSSDLSATAAYLTQMLGQDGFITPDSLFEQMFREMRETVVQCVLVVTVILAIMCVCVFFIMRSSFMSRVREVGVLRAIGVSKKNLLFRFAVETMMLVTMTLALGYFLSAWFIGSLSGATLFSSIFYFPWWMATALFVILCVAALFFGVLPAMLLLRKTPSAILSKYDI